MSATADAGRPRGLADKLGVRAGQVVQEIGHDDDVDEGLRAAVMACTGQDLVGADSDEIVDLVLLWWREGEGDLVDSLVDALSSLAPAGVLWLLTPKTGRSGHVEPSDVTEAASAAGLAQTSSVSAAADWSGARLVAPRTSRAARR